MSPDRPSGGPRPDRGPEGAEPDPARRSERNTLSTRTRAEHDALVVAMHRLDASLACAAPGRERQWARRVSDDFDRVREALARHVASTEGSSGLFAEVERGRPTMASRLGELKRQHAELLAAAEALAGAAREGDPLPDFRAIRRQAADLLFAVRHHHGEEVDLVYEAFWTDLGAGD
jgi:hypothetical protein